MGSLVPSLTGKNLVSVVESDVLVYEKCALVCLSVTTLMQNKLHFIHNELFHIFHNVARLLWVCRTEHPDFILAYECVA